MSYEGVSMKENMKYTFIFRSMFTYYCLDQPQGFLIHTHQYQQTQLLCSPTPLASPQNIQPEHTKSLPPVIMALSSPLVII